MDQDEINTRVELRALIDAYSNFADLKDYDGWASTFAEDGTCSGYNPGEDEPFVVGTGRTEIAAMLHGNDQFPNTFHAMSNHHVTFDGDKVTGVTYGTAHHLVADSDDTEAIVWLIRYLDEYAKTSEGWKFASRQIRIQWIEYLDSDVSPYPFRKGRSTLPDEM